MRYIFRFFTKCKTVKKKPALCILCIIDQNGDSHVTSPS